MDLTTFYLASMSVAATLFSILLLIAIIASIWAFARLSRLLSALDRISGKAINVAEDIREFVHASKERLLAIENLLLTARGLQNIAGSVKNAFRRERSTQKKGDDNGEE